MRHTLHALCSTLLAALALSVAGGACAGDLVARQGDDSVRLTEAPCASEAVLARIEPQAAAQFQAASGVFQGQRFAACWRPMGAAAHIVYEDGDQGIVPFADLHPAMDI